MNSSELHNFTLNQLRQQKDGWNPGDPIYEQAQAEIERREMSDLQILTRTRLRMPTDRR